MGRRSRSRLSVAIRAMGNGDCDPDRITSQDVQNILKPKQKLKKRGSQHKFILKSSLILLVTVVFMYISVQTFFNIKPPGLLQSSIINGMNTQQDNSPFPLMKGMVQTRKILIRGRDELMSIANNWYKFLRGERDTSEWTWKEVAVSTASDWYQKLSSIFNS